MATYSNDRTTTWNVTGSVHQDCREVLEENPLPGLTEAQLNQVYDMMQLAWNRGYKKGWAECADDMDGFSQGG